MDVNAVLQSVQERDKWRRRLALLTETLGDVRERRRKAVSKLRKIQTELKKVGDYSEAILDHARAPGARTSIHGTRNSGLPGR